LFRVFSLIRAGESESGFVFDEFDVDDFVGSAAGFGTEFTEQEPQFSGGGVDGLLVHGVEAGHLGDVDADVLGQADFADDCGGIEFAQVGESELELLDLVEENVVVGEFGDEVPVCFEELEVGVDGGLGDVEDCGALGKRATFLAQVMCADHSLASLGGDVHLHSCSM
jgi:hypothetical protein